MGRPIIVKLPEPVKEFIERIREIGFTDGEANYPEMYELVEDLRKNPNARVVVPYMFEFFEANFDKVVGNPGPFVHFIEEVNDYHKLLKSSVRRKPTDLTLWMVNRILNVTTDRHEREEWLGLLRGAITNPSADPDAREAANDFLQGQNERAT